MIPKQFPWVAVLASAGLLAALTPLAAADLSGTIFSIEAQSAAGNASWAVCADNVQWHEVPNPDGGDPLLAWALDSPIVLVDPDSGAQVARIDGANLLFDGHPQVNLGFAMTAGSVITTFTVKSALLTIDPAMLNPLGRATAGLNVSDADGDGALLTGAGPSGGAYLAQFNGFVPGGITFSEAIDNIAANVFSTGSGASDSGWLPIAGPVDDMSTQISFRLSPNDFASGTSSFQLVPDPASLLLAGAGLVWFRRR